MEDKQLDFNQPLLSVRRFTSPGAASDSECKKKTDTSLPKILRPPIYKSELKSGPVRNPGTVPFVWEKTPGRPKEESNSQAQALEQPLLAPRLPPGRILNDKQHSSRKGFNGKTFTPSQTGTVPSCSQKVSSLKRNETKYESSSGDMEETGSSGSKDSDEAYVDALDTFSRTESFFLNCSISGVSGFDGPEIKPSGIFTTDPQTRDFMMGRFLPAAKAVASEIPPYASRKQPVAREPQRQVKKVVIVDKQQPLYVSSPNKFPNHAQDDWLEESEGEDDYSGSQNSSAKVCGLFPQFLLKSSFCLLNPVPGMKIQAQKPAKPAHSVRRRQAKSSYLRSGNETESEYAKAATEKGLTRISRTEELIEDKNNLKSGSSHMSYRSDCQNPDAASLSRHLQGNVVSSYPSQISQLVHQEKGFLGIPEKAKNYGVSSIDPLEKGSNNFQELLALQSKYQESGLDSPVVEKTLYVDSVHKVISTNPYFSATKTAQGMEDDSEIVVKPGKVEETPSVDSLLQDIKHLNCVVDDKVIVQRKSLESVDSYSLFPSEKYAPEMELDATNGSRRDQDLIKDSCKLTSLNVTDNKKDDMESQLHVKLSYRETSHGLVQDSITLTKSKVGGRRKIGLESHLQKKSSNQESSHGSYSKLPLAPPLPKAPSESWLKRTLPTVSSRNSSSRSCLATCNYSGTQASLAPSSDPKWETIVRSSNVHHGHLRFSEEQLPAIPEA
ncbi:PREDICTED: uncharacterized protein LOC18612057 [Theobroma cacao]|uniref:Uncharacterized protein LOC18612057 n=1 Tax=Theobroma cacao TaxID=3641 RepID=A0AB32VPX1_THECC|nr:PREDICTED: uncharacterized protein LOC18612057 [Theobroma cacao]